jgi:hypothetical protein
MFESLVSADRRGFLVAASMSRAPTTNTLIPTERGRSDGLARIDEIGVRGMAGTEGRRLTRESQPANDLHSDRGRRTRSNGDVLVPPCPHNHDIPSVVGCRHADTLCIEDAVVPEDGFHDATDVLRRAHVHG